jgi:hypothetical protein
LRHPVCFIDKVEHPDPDPLAPIQYACIYWIDHLCKIKSSYDKVSLYDNGTINVFLRKHFLHWLEALSLIKGISDGVLAITKLIGLLTVSCHLRKVEYLQILINSESLIRVPTPLLREPFISTKAAARSKATYNRESLKCDKELLALEDKRGAGTEDVL